jgi:hypothetical protein
MNIKIFPKNELFIGLKFTISNIITNRQINTYDNKGEYPKMYSIDIGLLFIVFEINIKGGN